MNLDIQTLDRTTAPALKQIEKIELIQAQKYELNNGIPAYIINAGTQDVVKIEFIFKAGSWYDSQPLVSDISNALINAGTTKFTAEQLADSIDYYGAYLELEADYEHASVSVYTLNKHLTKVLPFIDEMIKGAIFPEHELAIHIQNSKQRLQVSEEKVADVCRKRFRELLYGSRHPYGVYAKAEDYNKIKRDDVLKFYNQYYHSGNCTIIASGKISTDLLAILEKHFGRNDWERKIAPKTESVNHLEENKITKEVIFKENALQSALRVGRKLFNKTHPDYHGMQIVNTIFGAYYGSRLMKNIREDKGYTYGIHSAIASFNNSGYFFISTEVGVEVCREALDEIYYEMEKLKNVPVNTEELQLVKNYMTGMFLKSIDSPFSLADRFKGILFYGLSYDYYNTYLQTIQSATAEQLQQLAQRYLIAEEMTELVVGKK